MKKAVIGLALAAALVVGQTAVTAAAHGHGGCHGSGSRQPVYSLCNVEECNIVGLHKHDGTYYCGHYIGDGHDYHEVCDVEGCTLIWEHAHDGTTCLPYGCHGSQQSMYSLCNVEECSMVGLHEHDGTYYCGHYIGDGHDYHEVCSVKGCILTTEHEHDGTTCLPYNCDESSCSRTFKRSKGRCHH